MKLSKRVLALALCLVMFVSLLPVTALATEEQGEPQQTEQTLVPEELGDTEEAEEVEAAAEAEVPQVNEVPAPEEEVQEEAPELEPVRVRFACTPEDAALTVFAEAVSEETGEAEWIEAEPEDDGSYLLLPGRYAYDASAEGYGSAEKVEFDVEADEELVEIDVLLTAAEEEEAEDAVELIALEEIKGEELLAGNSTYAQKAIAYADAHWNDGQGECAAFVVACLRAGGISIPSTYTDTGSVCRWLTEQGYEKYTLVGQTGGSWHSFFRKDNLTVEPGDVVFWSNKGEHITDTDPYHTGIVGDNYPKKSGGNEPRIAAYQHNSAQTPSKAWENKTYKAANGNTYTYGTTSGLDMYLPRNGAVCQVSAFRISKGPNQVGHYKITYDKNTTATVIDMPRGTPDVQQAGWDIKIKTQIPKRTDGYTFLGWSTNKSATTAQYQPGSVYSGQKNTTLYAIWSKNGTTPTTPPTTPPTPTTYTIKFNANASDVSGSMNNMSVAANSQFTVPEGKFTRSGYKVWGWTVRRGDGKWLGQGEWVDSSGVRVIFRPGAKPTLNSVWTSGYSGKEYTLYAQWSKVETPSADPVVEMRSPANGAKDFSVTGTVYGKITWTGNNKPTKWYMKWGTSQNNLSNRSNVFELSESYVSDNNPVKINIQFGNSGDGAAKLSEGTTYYYRFYCENAAKKTFEGPLYHLTTVEPKRTYTVSFDSRDGSPVSPKTVSYGEAYGTLPTPTRTGYTFDGWYTYAGGQVFNGTTVSATADHTLHARWTANSYTLSFNSQGGEAVSSKSVTYNAAYGLLRVPRREGYTFDGWYTSFGALVTDTTRMTTAANHTLYARWTAITEVRMWFMDEDLVLGNRLLTVGAPYGELMTPTKSGYAFLGWYTEETGGRLVTSATIVTNTINHELFARWEYVGQYSESFCVSYYDRGGASVPASQWKDFGVPLRLSTQTPTKAGYTFICWHDDTYGDYLPGDYFSIDDAVILEAVWAANSYCVTFNANSGSVSQEYKYVYYNDYYGELPTPARPGYDFLGWFTDPVGGGQRTSSSKNTAASNHTLYAQWRAVADGIEISSANFHDANFRSYVSEQWDADGNGYLNETEIAAAKEINVKQRSISSLAGIEHFTLLTHLYCHGNSIGSLDLSGNPELIYLQCANNQLTSLNVSENSKLEKLLCGYNPLTALDVSKNPALKSLDCEGTGCNSLDLSNNPELENLYCANNPQLMSLDLSDTPKLQRLTCSNTGLTSLDVSITPMLECLCCERTQLTGLDLRNCPVLLSVMEYGEKTESSMDVEWLVRGDPNYLLRVNPAVELITTYSLVTSGTCGEGVTWSFDEASGTLTISGGGETYFYDSENEGDFNTPWAHLKNRITKLVFDGYYLGSYAFENCDNLTEVVFTDGPMGIAEGAFDGCSALSDVYTNWDINTWFTGSVLDGLDACEDYTVHCSDGDVDMADVFAIWMDTNGSDWPSFEQTVIYGKRYGICALGSRIGALPEPTWEGHTFKGWFTQPVGGTQVTSDTLVETREVHTLYAQWISDKRAGTPTGLKWGDEYGFPGAILWTPVAPDFGATELVILDQTNTAVYSTEFSYEPVEPANEWWIDTFRLEDFPSGSYTFRVTQKGDGAEYQDGQSQTSDSWSYVKPSAKLAKIQGLQWTDTDAVWTALSDPQLDGYWVEVYCRESMDEEPWLIYNPWVQGSASAYLDLSELIHSMDGDYYSFRVKALSIDMTQKQSSDWSDMSPWQSFNIQTYTVSYNANGGTNAPEAQTKTKGEPLTLSSTKPSREDSSAGSYTVTLNPNGGNVSTSSLTATRITSYTFKNWNTAANGSGTSYNAGASYTVDAAATLYAQWDSSTSTAAVSLPTPTRSGYTFKGWATSSGAASGVTGSYTPSGNVTLYAIWTQQTAGFTGWKKLDGVWYYYKNGAMVTNAWAKDSKGTCYLGADGRMVKSQWVELGGKRYYMNASGYRVSGWQKLGGVWYFFKDSGEMSTNCWTKDSSGWCYLGVDGRMVKSQWVELGGERYYLNASGYRVTGWQKLGGTWYFFENSGAMATNTWKKDSKGWCYLGSDGKMITNAWKADSKGTCYLGADGRMAIGKWIKVDGAWYYMNASGYRTSGWQKVGGKWYYMDASGVMQTGWLEDNGKRYYLDSSGVMVTGKQTIDGTVYTFSSSGVCQNP